MHRKALMFTASVLSGAPAVAAPSVHASQMAEAPLPTVSSAPRTGELPPPGNELSAKVYGYLAYWDDDLASVPWSRLTHLALFTAGSTVNGELTSTSRWGDVEAAVAMAEPYGVRVHLTVANFEPSELREILGSASARQNLIDELVAWQEQTGVHGVNIDFEGMPSSRRAEMVTFIRDLEAAVGEVAVATPSVDWSSAWDYAALSEHADLFIMGYGYHYSGSSQAGPVDPLYGESPWNKYSLDWTVRDYLDAGADPSRVLLGLPLYGIRWPTGSDAVPAATTGGGSSVFFEQAWSTAASNGARYDEASRTPWTFDGVNQLWYGDTESVRERIRYAVDMEIGGIGFWALHYDGDDPELWSMVEEELALPTPDEEDEEDEEETYDDRFVADAGAAFLAYPGDTIILSARGSTGPEGVPLQFRWTQAGGPSVALDDPTSSEPSFRVREPGLATFDLQVGDGTSFSAPDRSFVVVLDRDLADRHLGCGCSGTTGGGLAGAGLGLGLLVLLGRRREGVSTRVLR